ncbi:beta-lactamase, partial [Lacticaseibacillus rhamnosus]
MRQTKKRRWGRWLLLGLVIGVIAGIAIYGSYDYLYVRPQIAAKEERARRQYETELNRHRAIEQRLQNQAKADTGTTNKLMQPVDSPDAKPLLAKLQAAHFSGTVLMMRKGKVILNTGLGYADVDSGRLNGPETLYQIGSIQKGLTAVLLMKLVEQGKVRLSDPIGHYFTGIRTGKKVTLRMMLDMRSGLTLPRAQPAKLSDAGIVRWSIANLNYETPRYDYQPVNFVLLAGVIEKVTGRLYAD